MSHPRWKRRRHHRPPPGSAPGTLAPPVEVVSSSVHMIEYGPERIVEATLTDPADVDRLPQTMPMVWLDVRGLGSLEWLRAIGQRFGLHPLVLADIVHVNQRPKLERYEEQLFVVLRMPHGGERPWSEQVSMMIGKGVVVTFQERPGDCFEPVRERLRLRGARIRGAGADYLGYALIDAIIDSYFPILEHYGETIEALEEAVTTSADGANVTRIHALKRDLREFRRNLWPLREVVNQLLRDETPLIEPTTRIFLRDCADHVYQLMDMIEIDRELASDLMGLHHSTVGLRLNDVMKVLTIIATLFIPLGFIAGVYGMNFDRSVSPFNMPELGWYLGYPFALGLMVAVALGLLVYFRRKGWLGEERRP